MPKLLRIPLMVFCYAAFAVVIGFFSIAPGYQALPGDKAQLLLSVSHIGQPVSPCRRLSEEELQKIAANMRKVESCPRERLPLLVELELSGEKLYSESLAPSGLAGDGAAQAYIRLSVDPGLHELAVRLRDSARKEGFDYERTAEIELKPGERFVIDFRAEMGGFILDAGRN